MAARPGAAGRPSESGRRLLVAVAHRRPVNDGSAVGDPAGRARYGEYGDQYEDEQETHVTRVSRPPGLRQWQDCHTTAIICHNGGMLTKVAVLAMENIAPFELGVVCEVFGTDRGPDFPTYDFQLCTVDGGPVTTQSGYRIQPHADLTPVAAADLVDVLRAAAVGYAHVLIVCSGALLGGEAGLLYGRRCTTHWMYTGGGSRCNP